MPQKIHEVFLRNRPLIGKTSEAAIAVDVTENSIVVDVEGTLSDKISFQDGVYLELISDSVVSDSISPGRSQILSDRVLFNETLTKEIFKTFLEAVTTSEVQTQQSARSLLDGVVFGEHLELELSVPFLEVVNLSETLTIRIGSTYYVSDSFGVSDNLALELASPFMEVGLISETIVIQLN